MIIGDCPYEDCDNCHMIPCAERTPAYSKEECEKCKRPFWLYHSRWAPEAYTPEAFLKEFNVNEETKQITRKDSK